MIHWIKEWLTISAIATEKLPVAFSQETGTWGGVVGVWEGIARIVLRIGVPVDETEETVRLEFISFMVVTGDSKVVLRTVEFEIEVNDCVGVTVLAGRVKDGETTVVETHIYLNNKCIPISQLYTCSKLSSSCEQDWSQGVNLFSS